MIDVLYRKNNVAYVIIGRVKSHRWFVSGGIKEKRLHHGQVEANFNVPEDVTLFKLVLLIVTIF